MKDIKIIPALLTPLNYNLEINIPQLIHHIDWLLNNGCDSVLFMGTTGEANSFSVDERKSALHSLIDLGLSPEKLIFGAGCCAIPDTVELINYALSLDVNRFLLLPPFYYKNVSDDGLFNAFKQVIKQVNDERMQIYLYHYPALAVVGFSNSLIKRLVNAFPESIKGIKDSSCNLEKMQTLCEGIPGFEVFSGSEIVLPAIIAFKGAGCISATANLNSKLISNMIESNDEGVKLKVNQFREIMEGFPLIPALKQVVADYTNNESWLNLRPPLMPLNDRQKTKLSAALKEIDFPKSFM